MRLIFRIGASGLSEEERERKREREEVLSAAQQTKFSRSLRIFLFGLYNLATVASPAECFAEITCQNTYFPLASKFLFRPNRENVSMWRDGPFRKRAYYSPSRANSFFSF